jgi:hypothetical protein
LSVLIEEARDQYLQLYGTKRSFVAVLQKVEFIIWSRLSVFDAAHFHLWLHSVEEVLSYVGGFADIPEGSLLLNRAQFARYRQEELERLDRLGV